MVAIAFNLLLVPNSSINSHQCLFNCSRRSNRCSPQFTPWSRKINIIPNLGFQPPKAAAITSTSQGDFDPELRRVFELATDEELFELESILFGPSYFSPFLKSLAKNADIDYISEEDINGREDFIAHLESRFLYLAADARSTLRGWRPSYRNVLLGVRRKLSVPCSNKLSTEDLEVEIFLHLLQEYSSHESIEGLSHWKMNSLASLRIGAQELKQTIWKGGGMLTLSRIFQLLSKRLSGKMLLEAANYEIKHEIIKKGGQLASFSLESRVALLMARQGLGHAATRYLGLRSMSMLLGPLLWGTFIADVVIQMLGTDYARVLRAIYAFAQIRLTRTYGRTSKIK